MPSVPMMNQSRAYLAQQNMGISHMRQLRDEKHVLSFQNTVALRLLREQLLGLRQIGGDQRCVEEDPETQHCPA